MKCAPCGGLFGEGGQLQRVASISGSIVSVRGPVSQSEGDAQVELIKQCVEPWNKRCRCEAHRRYFGGWLD